MTRQEMKASTYAMMYGSDESINESVNFERIREKEQTEGYIPKGRKLNKVKRGGGIKGSFRKCHSISKINQEKYFLCSGDK